MSKRELKIYLNELSKSQLEEQVLDLYTRFKQVKTYYNFVFNPKEDKLLDEAKFKIAKEYFPLNGRKPKTRRSVAQKIIKLYIQLGVDAYVITEIMLFNIEVAQRFTIEKTINQTSFYSSMFKSFNELLKFTSEKGIDNEFSDRINTIISNCKELDWPNYYEFETKLIE